MNDYSSNTTTTELDEDEEILTYTLSDEALEAAADKRGALTFFHVTGPICC